MGGKEVLTHMEEMIPCPVEDREVFQRVWNRVMAGRDGQTSPIEPIPPGSDGDLSCECLKALYENKGEGVPPACEKWRGQLRPGDADSAWRLPQEPETPWQTPPLREEAAPAQGQAMTGEEMARETEAMRPEPARPEASAPERAEPEAPAPEEPCGCGGPEGLPPAETPDQGNDMPRLWETPVPSDDRTARLRAQVMEALQGWQFYRHLAKRARGMDQRVLNSMAAELHRHARKLSAAYFLLTGLRYWPTELLGTPAIPSYWGAMRQRHQAEQRMENGLRLAADDWEDGDILAMYDELIEGCQHRCRQLRALLERDE